MSIGVVTVILFVVFAVLLFLGCPISVSIVISSIAAGLSSLSWDQITFITMQKMNSGVESFSLLAIPLFILAGNIMNNGGIAKRLVDFAKLFVGWIPGSLAQANVVGNMLFGALSGSSVAAASAMGGCIYPIQKEEGYLKDVVSGTKSDRQIRCNQIWALTMPFTMVEPDMAARVVDTVFRHLYTPVGLRTLSPEDPQFCPAYGGPQRQRDLAYHQGTVWPFPLGAYYLAYLRVHGGSAEARLRVRRQLRALGPALREGCVGFLPEIYDGANPTASRGCFAQAWSVGELLRVLEALEHNPEL